ncbi:MAG TPA: zinc ribbon domain-containing protein [Pirellulales bacterium]
MATASTTAELANTPHPAGHACASCGSPVEDGDKYCNVCGAQQIVVQESGVASQESGVDGRESVETTQAASVQTRSIQCKNCGATINVPINQRSVTCPFCDSNYVVDAPADAAVRRQTPEFVIGFALTPQQALEKFRQWLRDGGVFRPGDLYLAKIEDKLRGMYVPFWSFSMLAQSRWSARVGEHWYREETYTTWEDGKPVTRTRTVIETEWWGLSGQHHNYYSGYLVSGSKGLPQAYAEKIKPYRLESLKRYAPYYLAGWSSEEYSVECDEALIMCQQEFQRWEVRNVEGFLPGDTHSDVAVDCQFSAINSDLILLPVYLLSYRYGEKLYRFLLNGQTGKVTGDKPLSSLRIGLAATIGVAVALIVWWIFSHR